MSDSATQGTFDDLLIGCGPEIQAITKALKSAITARHSDLLEIVWPRMKIASYGIGPKKMSEHHVYIAPQKNHVNLGFYHGVALKDPSGLLEGAGKRLRHIKIKSISEAMTKEIASLIEGALAERKKAVQAS